MLIEFSVANDCSFRAHVPLSREAESRRCKRDKTLVERKISRISQGEILRGAGLYGAFHHGLSARGGPERRDPPEKG